MESGVLAGGAFEFTSYEQINDETDLVSEQAEG